MKPVSRLWPSSERPAPQAIGDDRRRGDDTPTPGELLTEAGLLLAIHLAVAFAVVLTLRVCGIA